MTKCPRLKILALNFIQENGYLVLMVRKVRYSRAIKTHVFVFKRFKSTSSYVWVIVSITIPWIATLPWICLQRGILCQRSRQVTSIEKSITISFVSKQNFVDRRPKWFRSVWLTKYQILHTASSVQLVV